MTMQSSSLLPALRELPRDESGQTRSFRETITGIVNMDRSMYAAEFASGVSFGLWYIFDDRTLMGMNIPGTGINLDDDWRETLTEAHELAFPNETRSVWQHFQGAMDNSENFNNAFMSPYKGKVAEVLTKQDLEAQGWTQVTLAPELDTELIDIIGVDPEGYISAVQCKFGKSFTGRDVQELESAEPEEVRQAMVEVLSHPDVDIQGIMPDEPDLYLSLSRDTVVKATDAGIDVADKLVAEISPDLLHIEGPTDALETLVGNWGIDVPDSLVEMVPYIGEISVGVRLIWGAIRTENQFKAVDRTEKNKMHVVQALTAMARIGITAVSSAVGGTVGSAIGSILPVGGNIIGGGIGILGGAGGGMYLNRKVKPHILNLALNITGMTNDDLFYYKNKVRIDNVALSYQEQARALAAPT